MNALPRPILDAIDALSDLPGIGSRSAERLVFSLLKNKSGLNERIGKSLVELSDSIQECEICCNLSQAPLCGVCSTPTRDGTLLCIVESPMDILAVERTHEYRGVYHVLHGVISPLGKVAPQDLRIAQLLKRLQGDTKIQEIVIATSGNVEGDATALYLAQELEKIFPRKVTRLARGIPSGGELDYIDPGTLGRAMADRRMF